MIRAEGVVKEYGGRAVLNGVDLEVRPGEAVALFGPNGAGKSTLLRVLAGLTRPDRGQVLIDGTPVLDASPDLRRRMAVLAHQSYLYDNLSGEENLQFWARIYGVRNASPRIAALLKRVGLWAFAGDPVRTYSRGMVQRLALARLLLHDPELYLLDEPFTGLDRAGVRLLREVLAELKERRRTLLVISHRPDEVVGVCHRFLVLVGGRIRYDLTPAPRAGLDGASMVRELEDLLDRAATPEAERRP